MALIVPFRGLLFDPEKVSDLSKVVSPPYDVISPKAKNSLLKRHPLNVVRIILPPEEEGEKRYDLSASLLKKWEKDGILKIDKEPAFYYYRQIFSIDSKGPITRDGFIALVRIESLDSGIIFPHEKTTSKPVEDRLNLLRACKTNLSQIFTLYSDPENFVDETFSPYLGFPFFNIVDDLGDQHIFWRVTNKKVISTISKWMIDKPIFIADGHHRYTTAMAYREEMKAKDPNFTGKEPYNFVMTYFTNMDNPGLTILPTHRLLLNLGEINQSELMEKFERYFNVTLFPFNNKNREDIKRKFLLALKERGRISKSFGLFIHGMKSFVILSLKNETDLEDIIGDVSEVIRNLDVTILNHIVLEKIFNISKEERERGIKLNLIKNSEKALDIVYEGRCQVALLLNPTRIDEVRKVASIGEVMPAKSTFFYPKLLTGLVFYKMVPGEVFNYEPTP